jgi:hypothetical protein
VDFERQIRAAVFTQMADYAVFRTDGHGFTLGIDFQHLFWTKGGTNAATLAPIPIDDVFVKFYLGHRISRLNVFPCQAFLKDDPTGVNKKDNISATPGPGDDRRKLKGGRFTGP